MADAGQWFGFVEMAPGAPPLGGQALASRPEEVSVVMHVVGGPPEQRCQFVKPDGWGSCQSSDALLDPTGLSVRARISVK